MKVHLFLKEPEERRLQLISLKVMSIVFNQENQNKEVEQTYEVAEGETKNESIKDKMSEQSWI